MDNDCRKVFLPEYIMLGMNMLKQYVSLMWIFDRFLGCDTEHDSCYYSGHLFALMNSVICIPADKTVQLIGIDTLTN